MGLKVGTRVRVIGSAGPGKIHHTLEIGGEAVVIEPPFNSQSGNLFLRGRYRGGGGTIEQFVNPAHVKPLEDVDDPESEVWD